MVYLHLTILAHFSTLIKTIYMLWCSHLRFLTYHTLLNNISYVHKYTMHVKSFIFISLKMFSDFYKFGYTGRSLSNWEVYFAHTKNETKIDDNHLFMNWTFWYCKYGVFTCDTSRELCLYGQSGSLSPRKRKVGVQQFDALWLIMVFNFYPLLFRKTLLTDYSYRRALVNVSNPFDSLV